MVTRADITLDKLLNDLAEDRALARTIEQPSAAIQATQLTAKLVGLLVDRKETGGPGDFALLSSRDELLAALRAEMGEGVAGMLEAALALPKPSDQALTLDLTAERLPDEPVN